MTIKHAISKIEWALNYYIAQSRRKSSQLSCQRVPASWRRDVVRKATSGRRGLEAQMSWGPEKMLIRCSKESQHPAEWALGLRLSSPREQERHNVTVITVGSKYFSYVRSPAPSHTQTLNNPFEPLQIKWEVNILLKKTSCVVYYCVWLIHCVSMYLAWTCRWRYNKRGLLENIAYEFVLISPAEFCKSCSSFGGCFTDGK